MNEAYRPAVSPYFSVREMDSWQGEQVISATLAGDTGDAGSLLERMPCSPWQCVQTGASVSPRNTN
jgi:hypothetical protein